jgi:hypothetical protein
MNPIPNAVGKNKIIFPKFLDATPFITIGLGITNASVEDLLTGLVEPKQLSPLEPVAYEGSCFYVLTF